LQNNGGEQPTQYQNQEQIQNQGEIQQIQTSEQEKNQESQTQTQEAGSIVPAPTDQQQIQEQAQNPAIGQQMQNQQEINVKAQNMTQLKEMIQQQEQAMAQEISQLQIKVQNVYKNQNEVKTAVHAFLAAENLIGCIGKQVSEIARQFNNSVRETIRAEEKIQTKSKIKEFFFGGDKKAADEITLHVKNNKNRTETLAQLINNCENCSAEIKNTLAEQIKNMEQEQNRLQKLAQNEIKKKGLFGWLFGWL